MRGMQFSIDIIWISRGGEIVDLRERIVPRWYPQVFMPTQPVRYVLEVPAHFISKHDVSIGDRVQISPHN